MNDVEGDTFRHFIALDDETGTVTVYRAAGFCPAREILTDGSLMLPWMAGS